ncbi:MAG TPA: hypothetical protein VMW64_03430 [Dehalococcoidia bacterium]|nr:hypothetical protein [Dehalococcoidia bacterium]
MAAYSTANSPRRVDSGLLSQRNANESGVNASDGGGLWSFTSTAVIANLKTAGWISNAKAIGMRQGDVIFAVCNNSTGAAVALNVGVLGPLTTAGAGAFVTGSDIKST